MAIVRIPVANLVAISARRRALFAYVGTCAARNCNGKTFTTPPAPWPRGAGA